jgi:uncharacterized membrane protein (GlpM family)
VQYFIKTLLSALIIVAVSEVSKRNTTLGALLVSLPLTSILAMCWIYSETKDLQKLAVFSKEVCWFVLPSLILFIVFPVLVAKGWGFWGAIGASCAATVVGYLVGVRVLAGL